MKHLFTFGVLTMLAAGQASAQRFRDVVNIQPRLTGGDPSNGRCIVRIMVDDTVNVRIGNGQIRVETLQGRPTRDDGSECTSMLQNGRNLSDFRFQGRDGRGEVRLQSDPRQDPRGEAVIYIRDSKGGDEGYTFEVSWQGDNGRGSQSGNRGGFFSQNGNNDLGDNRALNSCIDRVRTQVQRDYGVTNLNFDNVNADNNSGSQDRITGTAREDGRREVYSYECRVNPKNGNVRNVRVRRN